MKNMKKLGSILLMLCMVFLISVGASAASGKGGDRISWKLASGKLTLTGKKAMENHSPAGAGYESWVMKNVTMETGWDYWPRDVKSVVVSKGITRVGDSAFAKCRNMTTARMADSVTKIGSWAFLECESLKSVYIPSSVKNIGYMAFYNCSSLKDVYYAGSKSQWAKISIGSDNDALKKATIHYGVSGIDSPKSKQTIKVTSTFTKTVGNKDFSLKASAKTALSYASSNKSVVTVSKKGKVTIKGAGKATITITAAEGSKYQKATKKVTITVQPKAAAVKSVKRSNETTATVKWKKVSGISGYEIQYSTSSSFKNASKVKAASSKTSVVLKKLQAGKKYYTRIRTYKVMGGTTYYSNWSAKKTIKKK